jgi:hypothetical protein
VRAVRAIITQTKRKKPYQKEAEQKDLLQKIEVKVVIDPKDLFVINNGKLEENKKCSYDLAPLAKAMLDISTQDKLEQMVSLALKVPTDLLCFSAHLKIMSIFERYGIQNQSYVNFLQNVLNDIEDPSQDIRAYEILDFWQKQGPMEDAIWESALSCILRTQKHQLYRMLPKLFFHEVTSEKDTKRELQRIDKLVKSALENKLGRPMPVNFDEAMELFLRSAKSYRTRENPWAALYLFHKYHQELKRTNPDKIQTALKGFYDESQSEMMKSQWNDLMLDNVRIATPSYELSKKLVDHFSDIGNDLAKLDDEEDEDAAKIKMLQKHLRLIARSSGPNFITNMQMFKQDYEKKQRASICLMYELNCPELLPDQERFEKLLASKKASKRIEALELLQKMPAMASKLEELLFQNLIEANNGKIENANEVLKETAIALAAIPTKNPKILSYLVDMSINSRLSAQYTREQLGKGLEPLWLEQLKKSPQRHHMMIMNELNEYTKLSKLTCEYMQQLEKSSKEYYIVDAAKKALLERCR